MSTHLIVSQALAHTPAWVWVLLAVITLLGLRQAFDHVQTTRRIVGSAVGWTLFSAWGATSAFGFSAPVLLAWASAAAVSVALQHWLIAPRGVRALDDGRHAVRGSLWPLLTFWAVFGVRYVSGAMLALHPELTRDPAAALAVPAVYGLLCGVFIARAMRVLWSATAPAPLALA